MVVFLPIALPRTATTRYGAGSVDAKPGGNSAGAVRLAAPIPISHYVSRATK
jgi:hypothetical protein